MEDNLKAGKTRDRHNSDAEKAFNIKGVESDQKVTIVKFYSIISDLS